MSTTLPTAPTAALPVTIVVRRIGNAPLQDAVATLQQLLAQQQPQQEPTMAVHWMVESLLLDEQEALCALLDAHQQTYTIMAHEWLADYREEAPLVFADDDPLHRVASFINLQARQLDANVFAQVYQHKLDVLRSHWQLAPATPSQTKGRRRVLQTIGASEQQSVAANGNKPCRPVWILQWDATCRLTPQVQEAILQQQQQLSASPSTGSSPGILVPTSVPTATLSTIPTTPHTPTTAPPQSLITLDQTFATRVEQRALQSRRSSNSSGKSADADASYSPERLVFYNQAQMQIERAQYQAEVAQRPPTEQPQTSALTRTVQQLLALADQSLTFGPWSVMHKPNCSLLPDFNCHYYYSRSPYYWPDPVQDHVRRDGYRVPGSVLHDSESEKYDRTRLSDMETNTTLLALGWFYSGNLTYAATAAQNLRTWFLDPVTRMEPTLQYSRK
jgi:hypothetical protein